MRNRFAALWAAFGTASLADGIYQVALPLAALQAGGGAGAVALVLAVSRISWVLLALPAGVLVDRVERDVVMRVASLVRVVAMMVVAGLAWLESESLPVLVAVAFTMGTCEVLFDTALHSSTPAVVDTVDLDRANGRLQTTETVANQMAGPALGGLLAGVAVGVALGTTALLYVAAVVAVLGLREARPATAESVPTEPSSVWAAARSGLAALRSDRPLLGYAVGGLLMNTAFAGALAALPILALDDRGLGLSGVGYGLLLTAAGVGGAITGLVVDVWVRAIGTRAAVGTSCVAVAAGLSVPAYSGTVALVAVGLALTGAIVVVNVVTVSYRQRVIPDLLLGRVTAAYRLLVFGGLPLGSAMAGVVGSTMGSRWVFVLAALLTSTAGAVMVAVTPRTAPKTRRTADRELACPFPANAVDAAASPGPSSAGPRRTSAQQPSNPPERIHS